MRILSLALCGVLLTAGLAQAAPADRAAILERLRQALPKFGEMIPMAEMVSGDIRKELIAQNPGKDAGIGPIANDFGACFAKALNSRDANAAAITAADQAGMTEAELLKVVAFYEDPAVKSFFASVGPAMKSGKEPQVDPALFKRVQDGMQDPAVMRFSQMIRQSSQDLFKDPVTVRALSACTTDLDKAVAAAGLTHVKARGPGRP
jgi:hypothetical protein